jgi:glucosamine-6-phosphate deaminase
MNGSGATSKERVPVRIFADSGRAAIAVAERIAELIRETAAAGRRCVLGLATGHTPINVYRELVRMHREDGLDFANVETFNLDEYWPIDPAAIQSYTLWMDENFFKHVNVPPENIHIPSGTVSEADIDAHCAEYEDAIAAAGGIDFQILGIGRSGHIGFNEPGSPSDSLTRRILLDRITRLDAASDFFGEENVPEMAITMGVGTILEAREIALLAFGEHKAPVVRRAVEEDVSRDVAASFLQGHANACFYLDAAAAGQLTRVAQPWLVTRCIWDDALQRQAVIWLARTVNKPILMLTDDDYGEHGLGTLVRTAGGAYELNLMAFRYMMNTITGWPGGKEGQRKVLILSPHPDDDVICMGGTLTRLVQRGHDVHVAYMVTGSLSVFDADAAQYTEFVRAFHGLFDIHAEQVDDIDRRIEAFLAEKHPGEVDTPEIQAIKALIRRCEAVNAAAYCGLGEANVHFLNMPFYETGKVQKLPIGEEDVALVLGILRQVKPDMIFTAGDMSDPHGTHRQCLQAMERALAQYNARRKEQPEVWLYRGAWEEWPPAQVEMASPMSPDEMRHKRFAIFRHESQKDRAMFPGPYDSREFWQRAEARNRNTAEIYDQLGLPQYAGVEAFVRWPIEPAAAVAEQLENGAEGPEETT